MVAFKVSATAARRGNSARMNAVDIRPGKVPPLRLSSSPCDKRSWSRVSSNLPVTVRFGGIYEAFGHAINLSARGLFFELDRSLASGAVVQLVFRLPPDLVGRRAIWLRCQAQVVRVEHNARNRRFRIAARLLSYEVFQTS